MKEYYGNYLGLCITGGDKDPDQRGRCQIFVPHIMPSLFEGWNELQKDKQINIVGTGLDDSLDPSIVNTLKEILPWAECATPIIGASPSGYVNSQGQLSEVNKNTAGAVAPGATGTITNPGASYLNPDATNALSNALANVKINETQHGYCSRDTVDALRTIGLFSGSIGSASGENADRMGHVYKEAGWTEVKITQPNQAPANSVVLAKDSSSGNIHSNIRLGDGNFLKTGIGGVQTGEQGAFWGRGDLAPGSYCAAFIPPKNAVDSFLASKGLSSDYNLGNVIATDGTPPTENPSSVKVGGALVPVQPANAILNGISSNEGVAKLATDRQAAFKKELQDPALQRRLAGAAAHEAGSGVVQQQLFLETLFNRAQFGGDSLSKIANDRRYYTFDDTATPSQNFTTAINNVLDGSNLTSLATDNAYNDKNLFARQFIAGTNAPFTVWNLNTGQQITDPAQIQHYVDNPAQSNIEIYYQKSGNTNNSSSPAGQNAAKYAAENNIKQSATTIGGDVKPFVPYATAQGPNTNNQAGGMFGYAHEGALVWVFFQGGNPLFPVYFAASYGQKEWNNIYQVNSPGKPGKGASINLHGGGINSSAVMPEDGGADPGFAFQVYGVNGSALTFGHDQSQFYTPYIHREHIGGDRHEIIMANKESHIQGTHNVTIYQDQFVSIGNFTEDAKLAHKEIQEILEKIPDFYK